MAPLSRNAQVLRYLLEVAPGVGYTKLLKFAYLADCEARQYLGQPITQFRYIRYDHGPFDAAFYAAKDELAGRDLLAEERVQGFYPGYALWAVGGPVEFDFDAAEAAILEYVADRYSRETARDLCDKVVYETEPMKGAEKDQPLKMERLDNAKRSELGFDLERLVASEASVRAGRFRPLRAALDELRTRDHPRG